MLRIPLVAAALALFFREPSMAASLTEYPSPVVSLFMPRMPGVSSSTFTGAAFAYQPAATTYMVGCFSHGDYSGACSPATVAQGALSYSMGWAQGGTWSEALHCVPEETTSLGCKHTVSSYDAIASTTSAETTTTSFTGSEVNYVPVTITAGQEMVAPTSAAAPRITAGAVAAMVAAAAAAAVAV